MNIEHDDLSRFQDAYLDYLEGNRDKPPALEHLPEEQRRRAEAFVWSITAARGVDPYASRPSIEQLLESRSQTTDPTRELGELLQDHLRLTVDAKALVTPDAASAAVGLASALVIQARGMRIRVVPETTSKDLDFGLADRAQDIARVFSAFPDSHAVLYTTTGQQPSAVIMDHGDVRRAIETPTGETRAPRLRRSIADARTACELWVKSLIPEFEPLSIDLLARTTALEDALDPFYLANKVVREVSLAGTRARIEAKRATWQDFGDLEARCLATIVQEAQRGQLSEEGYRFILDELVRKAA